MKKIYSKCVFLDLGHGKLEPFNRDYVTSPSKEFYHKKKGMHNGGWIYEGVLNEDYGMLLTSKLVAKGIHVIPVSHNWKDTSLTSRTNIANFYNDTVQKGIYVSLHSNATRNHNARGFSVWTSPGQTPSDPLATKLIELYTDEFLGRDEAKNTGLKKLTQDRRDGDPDYEARFSVLVRTNMPAILIENLFFDNYEDAKILMSDWYKEAYTDVLVEWIEWCITKR